MASRCRVGNGTWQSANQKRGDEADDEVVYTNTNTNTNANTMGHGKRKLEKGH